MFFKIEYIVPQAIENSPFKIDRPEGSYRYIFFHFISPVILVLDGHEIELAPGSCILFSPQKAQKFYVENNRLNHDYIDFTLIDNGFFKSINFPLNTPIFPKMSNFISEQVKEIQKEMQNGEIGYEYCCNSKMINLFVTLSRKIHHRNVQNSKKYADELKFKFEEIRLSMYQNPDKINVNKLAKSLGFSSSRFNELYKAYFTITPIKDLTNARIYRVKELIDEDTSTKEIIRRIGFSSEEYFYRWFKKNFNTTKEQYIQNKDKKEE